MHPPLDRPHPECQQEIDGLRHCHATASKLRFWACNEVKSKLDKCFRDEKSKMLNEMNKDLEEKRREEYEQAALAFNKTGVTFRDFLENDPTYQKDLDAIKEKRFLWWW